MKNPTIESLEQAISHLVEARYHIERALGDTESGEISISEIDNLIEDIRADIEDLR